jgi:flagellar biosynthesis protein FlhB
LLSKVFTFISEIFFVLLGFVMGLISLIERLIPSQVSEHGELILWTVIGVIFLFSLLNSIDSMIKSLRSEVQDLRSRIEKIEKEKR